MPYILISGNGYTSRVMYTIKQGQFRPRGHCCYVKHLILNYKKKKHFSFYNIVKLLDFQTVFYTVQKKKNINTAAYNNYY